MTSTVLLILGLALMAYFYYRTQNGCLSLLGVVAALFLIGGIWNIFIGGEGIVGQITIGIAGLLITFAFFRRTQRPVAGSTPDAVQRPASTNPAAARTQPPPPPVPAPAAEPPQAAPPQPAPAVSPVDLNNSSEQEIAKLPGIGPIVAKRAVSLRASRGGYRSVEDFGQTLNLGSHVVERIRPMVTVSPPPQAEPPESSGRIVDF